MSIIRSKELTYQYSGRTAPAVRSATFAVEPGELIAVLGHNGCGKSTLVRHLNGLLRLQQGELTVAEIRLPDDKQIWKLRRMTGMVFQNPDNQFVSSLVEEDIAFGLENYMVPRQEIPGRVDRALAAVGMQGFGSRAPHTLSGGQKQRVALAGVLALEPDILIFDEATSMLDPEGREDVLQMIRRLHDQGRTILMVTHYVEEAVMADRIFLMKDGRVLAQGAPREILTSADLLQEAGLAPPGFIQGYLDLQQVGALAPEAACPLTEEELVELICPLTSRI